MVRKQSAECYQLAKKILIAAGTNERNADIVAEHLTLSNLSGVDTHGVYHLPDYVRGIKNGDILPNAQPAVLRETPTSVLVSGNWTFGHVAAKYTMEIAIDKARDQGLAVAALVQSHHIGRLGHFVEMAAAKEMISLVWASGFGIEAAAAVPYGGREKILHTNPMAMGFPAGEEPPMMFDFATSVVSSVKVINAFRKHEQLPAGWIVDKEGNPSTDPADFFSGGAHIPFGGHKGYALMMATEFLGRIFAGADAFAEAGRGGSTMRHQGVALIVLKADLFQSFSDYAKRADEMERRARRVAPAPGFTEVLVPGDLEARTRSARQKEGIAIPDHIWLSLVDLAQSLGVSI